MEKKVLIFLWTEIKRRSISRIYQILDKSSSTLPQLFQIAEHVEGVLLLGQFHIRVYRQVYAGSSSTVALLFTMKRKEKKKKGNEYDRLTSTREISRRNHWNSSVKHSLAMHHHRPGLVLYGGADNCPHAPTEF